MVVRFITGSRLSLKDILETVPFSEKFFGMDNDPAQLQPTADVTRWVWKRIPDCIMVLRDGKKLVGFTFMFPSTKGDMKLFLSHRITENELFTRTQKNWSKLKMDALYLCASLVEPAYRGKGLAFGARVRMIRNFRRRFPIHTFFSDPFSLAGRKLGRKLAVHHDVPILFRTAKPKRRISGVGVRRKR